ncbi:hypothetical protein [Myxococcus sp. RHSTA-1-4]|uniref:hypothetical protein n=1 Tax=Myxococcus sp. RHSTA-1-4 TaxID=2874601 RepID=UPI001CBD075A|nr:hypothetical protein [Myxococcus sp. RHSTA-1-4]MBZ4421087.1 hypothetical protein [Myxococcus sp. RHSTA-1-4]
MKVLCAAVLWLGVMSSGCTNTNCGDACERLRECGFQTSGLSCSDACDDLERECAACINDDWECDELSEACSARCFNIIIN